MNFFSFFGGVPKDEMDEDKKACIRDSKYHYLNEASQREIFSLEGRRRGRELTYCTIFNTAADVDHKEVLKYLESPQSMNRTFDRAMGSFLGMVLGDALGAPFEFSRVDYNERTMQKGFEEDIWNHAKFNRFNLKPGQWTDDASMGLCLADSLIAKHPYDGVDLRLRFHHWWNNGYCNAFGFDKRSDSVGLGGNISMSMNEFARAENPRSITAAGDKETSGNGSIMRNAAIPVFFHDDLPAALQHAALQSQATHQGDEAADCCRLLTFVVIKLMHHDGTSPQPVLETLGVDFEKAVQAKCAPSVLMLAHSKAEMNGNSEDEDRNWKWKTTQYKYSPKRAAQQPGYIGSYAMDAMAMALHCVWSTDTLTEAMLKCANLRGDSDSVCAVAGQIAGAIYGFNSIPTDWLTVVKKWDPENIIPLRAFKLYFKRKVF